jgi:hypothetical protein
MSTISNKVEASAKVSVPPITLIRETRRPIELLSNWVINAEIIGITGSNKTSCSIYPLERVVEDSPHIIFMSLRLTGKKERWNQQFLRWHKLLA